MGNVQWKFTLRLVQNYPDIMIFCLTVEIDKLLCCQSSFVFIKKEFCYKNVNNIFFFVQKGSQSLVSQQRIYPCFCDHVKNCFYFAFVINKLNRKYHYNMGPRRPCVLHPRFINHLPIHHNKSCFMTLFIYIYLILSFILALALGTAHEN